MPFELDTGNGNFAKIKVIGVGGGGGNAVNRMVSYGLEGAEFIVVNTDKQALFLSDVPQKIQIGEKLTKGLGSGADPETGKRAAEESRDDIEQLVKGADLVFIAAGLGGGTGTGAAPVVAEIAKGSGALTVAFVTMPFWFEGKPRERIADEGFQNLLENVDSIVKVPNNKLLEVMGKNTPLAESFKLADDALRQGIQGLTELIAKPALINLDFADVKSVMTDHGTAHMGIGVAYGENKVLEATKQAVMSPLLDTTIQGAKGVIFNIIMDKTGGLAEIEEAVKLVQSAADENANIFIGADIDENLEDEARVTVIATGFGGGEVTAANEAPAEASVRTPGAATQQQETQQRPTANFAGGRTIETREEEGQEEEPELPIFLKKSPRRIQMDD
ncbi:MAG: cell division protein FtsZ [Christensenellaceae bacterium]|jgi:cell division protein FtsZ